MRRRAAAILLALCMALTLLPTAAFAAEEGGAAATVEQPIQQEQQSVCVCEAACTAETMNADCPVCGAEGALPENCGKYAAPVNGEGSEAGTSAQALTSAAITFPAPKVGEKIYRSINTATAQSNTGSLTLRIALCALWEDGKTSELMNGTVYERGRAYQLKFRFQPDASLDALSTVTCNGQSVTLLESGEANETAVQEKMRNWDGAQDTYYAYVGEGDILWLFAYVHVPLATAEVTRLEELTAALADDANGTVKLAANIDITQALEITRTVTLDLNGHVLRLEDNPDSRVFDVKSGGSLTLTDSDTTAAHRFTPNTDGLWVLDEENGTRTVTGGVITGGSEGRGGGVYVFEGGTLTMAGGNIVGCRANGGGGGVYVYGGGTFTMNGGTIAGCVGDIRLAQGGGVFVHNGSDADAGGSIIDCVANGGMGGSVFIKNGVCSSEYYGRFIMNGGSISDCGLPSDSEDYNTIYNIGTFIANGGTVTNSGTGAYNYALYNLGIFQTEQGKSGTEFFGAAYNGFNGDGFDGGIFNGKVLNYARITGGTFLGTVTNRNGGGVIAGGTFESGSTVINESGNPGGTITGGTFNGTVDNNGIITGGTFNGTVTGTPALLTGSGTESDPYRISTAEGLKLFRDIVNGTGGQTQNPAAWAVLTANIDLKDEEWTPIGNESSYNGPGAYSGTFDGNGHTISGLKVSSDGKHIGLFGQISGATVKNLTVSGKVTGSVVYGGSYAGGIAGYALVSKIINCRNNCQVTGTGIPDQGLVYVGGIVGSATVSTITDCVNTGAIEMIGGGVSFIGGIAGCLNGTAVRGCSNTGAVSSHGDSREFDGKVGGIAGMTDGTVSGCYNTGSVTILYTGEENSSSAPAAGGIVGRANGEVRDCYNVGAVSATGARTYAGGIAGYRGNGGEVWKAYNVGRVTNTGGVIAGGIMGGSVTAYGVGNVYYLAGSAENGMGVDTDGDPGWDDLGLPLSDFANGKVLAEMINGREPNETSNPWADTCRYLAAAGKTLQVFKGQGDPHDHAFSKATCTSLAACSCGVTTGGLDPNSHTGTPGQWQHDADRHWKIYSCCNAEAEAGAHHGGEATCTAKAKCEVCKTEYGETNPANHTDLKHVPAKKATKVRKGNIEYWYCSGCGKYYKDAAATIEIAQKDTVIPRSSGGSTSTGDTTGKTDKTVQSQKTGDAGVALYGAMALLSLTGGAWIVGKKRRS